MTPPVDLPDWIEQPVPEYDLDPIHDAIGKFVRGCKAMEAWVAIAYMRFGFADHYAVATKTGPSRHVEQLAGRAHLLPADDQDTFSRAMADAAEILEIRNGVLHGIGYSDDAETMWQTKRPDRKARDPQAPYAIVNYDRDLLIGAGLRAYQIGGWIQSRSMHWFPRDEDLD